MAPPIDMSMTGVTIISVFHISQLNLIYERLKKTHVQLYLFHLDLPCWILSSLFMSRNSKCDIPHALQHQLIQVYDLKFMQGVEPHSGHWIIHVRKPTRFLTENVSSATQVPIHDDIILWVVLVPELLLKQKLDFAIWQVCATLNPKQ